MNFLALQQASMSLRRSATKGSPFLEQLPPLLPWEAEKLSVLLSKANELLKPVPARDRVVCS